MAIIGTIDDDLLDGTSGNDSFRIFQGGDDTATGDAGDDSFILKEAFTAADSIDGGDDNDKVVLSGDYSAGVVFGAATMTNVETLRLFAGNSYNLTTDDATVAAGQRLVVSARGMGGGNSLLFDGSAETDGRFKMFNGAGNDVLSGGSGADVFILDQGGTVTAHGGDGRDKFRMGGTLTAADTIDGGAGNDTLILDGDYSALPGLSFTATTMTNIERIKVAAGHSYTLGVHDGNASGTGTIIVDGSTLGASDVLFFGATSETTARYDVTGGAGADILYTGGGDTFHGGGGDDGVLVSALAGSTFLDGGSGNDTVILALSMGSSGSPLTLTGSLLASIETLVFSPTGSSTYFLNVDDTLLGSGATLTVNGTQGISGTRVVSFDGSAETDGRFVFIGDTGADVFKGGGGADTFDGGTGADTLTGNGGNDTFTGRPDGATDTYDGGSGTDTIDYSLLTVGEDLTLTLSATAGSAVGGDVGNDVVKDIENAITGAGDDTIIGYSVANVLNGGAGDDTLDGGAGDGAHDTLFGSTGTDTFRFEGHFGFDQVGDSTTVDWTDGEELVFVGANVGGTTVNFVNDGIGVSITVNDGSTISSVFVFGATAAQLQVSLVGSDYILS